MCSPVLYSGGRRVFRRFPKAAIADLSAKASAARAHIDCLSTVPKEVC